MTFDEGSIVTIDLSLGAKFIGKVLASDEVDTTVAFGNDEYVDDDYFPTSVVRLATDDEISAYNEGHRYFSRSPEGEWEPWD